MQLDAITRSFPQQLLVGVVEVVRLDAVGGGDRVGGQHTRMCSGCEQAGTQARKVCPWLVRGLETVCGGVLERGNRRRAPEHVGHDGRALRLHPVHPHPVNKEQGTRIAVSAAY